MTRNGGTLRWIALISSLIGIGLSIVLLGEHLTVFEGNHAEGFLCSGAGRFDCNPVAAHPAAWMLGMPVAYFGLLFYIVMAGTSLLCFRLPEEERAGATTVGALLAAVALIFDTYLIVVMVTQIGALCASCIATYVLNLALAIAFGAAYLRPTAEPSFGALLLRWRPRDAGPAGDTVHVPYKPLVLLLVIGGAATATVLTTRAVVEVRADVQQETSQFLATLSQPPPIPMSRFAGLPARGPENAPLTIVVAADFQCSWCRSLAGSLIRLRRDHPDAIREIYLNSPLTNACGPPNRRDIDADDCWLAETGAAAQLQGKFWEYHDYVFGRIPLLRVTPSTVRGRLSDIGLDTGRVLADQASGRPRAEIDRDVALRDSLHLDSTPSIVINGYPKPGGISPWALRAIVGVMLKRAGTR
jgi:uncharacterized membrane protein/protein-disulfide isomerase